MGTEKPAQPDTGARRTRGNRAYLIGLLVAFLVGLIPMWILAHTRAADRDAAVKEITPYKLTDEIALAGLHARRGEYEKARQHASDFFNRLRSAVDSPDLLTTDQRNALRPLLGQRDDVITLLARSDPAAVDRLFDLEYRLRQHIRPGS